MGAIFAMTSSLQGASHTFVAFACLYTVLVCVVEHAQFHWQGLAGKRTLDRDVPAI